MAKIEMRPKVELDVTLRLSLHEIAALDALAGYGVDEFLKVFYEHMGKSYLEPHEAGLRTLFESVRSITPSLLDRHQKAVKAFTFTDTAD